MNRERLFPSRREPPTRADALGPLAILTALALLGACSDGGGGDGPAPPPPAAANRAATAVFTVGAAPAAGQPVVLDARASSDADGDTLSYRWSFGDGGLGGGERLAHTFAAGGYSNRPSRTAVPPGLRLCVPGITSTQSS